MASKFLTGLAAGIVVGILFAPEKGTKTREKIAEIGNDLKDKFDALVAKLNCEIDDMTAEADDFASKAKSQFK